MAFLLSRRTSKAIAGLRLRPQLSVASMAPLRRWMAVKAIDSDADFMATLKANKDKGIVIDWAAAWCGPVSCSSRIATHFNATHCSALHERRH